MRPFFIRRIEAAIHARKKMALPGICTAMRLINAESDGLPGLVADRYGDFLVCQFLSAGAEHWKDVIVHILHQLVPVKGIFERSDADVRSKEGLPQTKGLLWGRQPPDLIEVQVGQIRFLVDIYQGHKTGCYLDQRENQSRIADFAAGANVLNCFSYSGVFGLWALRAGASQVTHLDASQEALALAEKNLDINHQKAELIQTNVFDQLRRYRDGSRRFDIIILDPPKFVASAGQLTKGCRGYKDINLLALKLLNPGGILFTFSCSGLVAPALFQKIVADAAVDARCRMRITHLLHQAADHPVASSFPEGHYLKGLICQVE